MKVIFQVFYTLFAAVSCDDINITGNFLPSPDELDKQKYFLFLVTDRTRFGISNIPIFPVNSISAIIIDTKELGEKFPDFIKLEGILSNFFPSLDSYDEHANGGFLEGPITNIETPEEIKIGTFFTAEKYFTGNSPWENFAISLDKSINELTRLEEHLALYMPKKELKKFELRFKKFKFQLVWVNEGFSRKRNSNGYSEKGSLYLRIYFPFDGIILEKFNSDFDKALKTLKNRLGPQKYNELEAKIMRMKTNDRPPGFGLIIKRETFLEKTKSNLSRNEYNIIFKEEKFTEQKDGGKGNLEINFTSFINLIDLFLDKLPFCEGEGNYMNLGYHYCSMLEKISSTFEEHFGGNIPEGSIPSKNISGENASFYWKAIFFVPIFFAFFIMVSCFLGYVYKREIGMFFRNLNLLQTKQLIRKKQKKCEIKT